MMATQSNRVENWLKQTWRITTPRDWLEACVEWIHSEHQGRSVAHLDLCQSVLEQWLLCDLCDIGASSLPESCSSQAKITLPGSYCLQVNSVVDVGAAYYAQIQKVQGTENDNVHVSATQMSQTQEPKAGRMLMFNMTDGSQTIKGMEYQPLTGFDINTPPGTKVLVQGPVLCRLGVIMLTKKNLVLLGGEVEAMVEANSKINVLKNKLNENTNSETQWPQLPRKTFDNKYVSKTLPGQRNREIQAMDTSQGYGGLINRQDNPMARPGNTWQGKEEKHRMDEDFPDDLDPEQLAALDDQWEDDDALDNLLMETLDQSNLKSHSGSFGIQQSSGSVQQRSCSSFNSSGSEQNGSIRSNYGIRREQVPNKSKLPPNVPRSRSVCESSSSSVARNSPQPIVIKPEGTNYSTKISNTAKPIIIAPVGTDTRRTGYDVNSNDALVSQRINISQTGLGTGYKSEELDNKLPVKLCEEIPDDDLDDLCILDSEGPKKRARKSCDIDLNSKPYTYLKLVQEMHPPTVRQTFRVKAFVSTLLCKLAHNEGRFWSLRVKINDGTAAMDVDLGDEMLRSLIGFTAQECHVMKEIAKSDMLIRQKMASGLKKCQQSLIQLSCILELELIPGSDRPTVVRQVDMTSQDIVLLQDRLS